VKLARAVIAVSSKSVGKSIESGARTYAADTAPTATQLIHVVIWYHRPER